MRSRDQNEEQREYANQREKLVENRDLPAVSPDGTTLELLANVNGPADAEMAVRTGATGVGLYRTEYLFLTHPTVPSEEEQYEAYKLRIMSDLIGASNRNDLR